MKENPIAITIKPEDEDAEDLLFISKRLRVQDFETTEEYLEARRQQSIRSFELLKRRSIRAGATSYIWRSCRKGDTCEVCKNNDGKTFLFHEPPKCGHPGHHKCGLAGYCRCDAEPVFS